ncbi:MAG: DUF1937 family protein [Lentisphaeria bacterium]
MSDAPVRLYVVTRDTASASARPSRGRCWSRRIPPKQAHLTYLASPYSDPDPAVREARFHAACHAASILMARGILVYSPIAHTHPIAQSGELPKGWEFWERYDRRMLAACDSLTVLCIPGWRESVGVQAEIAIAIEMGLPVRYVDGEGRAVSLSSVEAGREQ